MSNLIGLIAGEAGAKLDVFKGSEVVENIILLDKNGAPEDLTGGSVELEVHDAKTRTDTPTATFPATLTAATAGHATLTISTANNTLEQGTKYAWIKHTDSGGEDHFGKDMITLNVK